MSSLLTWLRGSDVLEAEVDAIASETHNATAQVTEHPVEKGAKVTDHVQVLPMRLSLEVVITNTPSALPKTHASGATEDTEDGVLQFSGNMQRPLDVWLDLKDALDAAAVFTINTALRTYDDMIMISLSVPREAGGIGSATQVDGETRVGSLRFVMEFQQIRIVASKEGKVQRKPKAGAQKPAKNKGKQPKKEATDQESALHKAGSALGAY